MEKKSTVVYIIHVYAVTSCTNVHVLEIVIWSFRGKLVNIMWRGFILKGAVEWRRKLAFAGAVTVEQCVRTVGREHTFCCSRQHEREWLSSETVLLRT